MKQNAVIIARPGLTVIELSGDIDAATAPGTWAQLSPLPPEDVVIDLSEVTFMGVAGLTLLLALCADERPGAARRFAAPPRCVRRLITLTSMDERLPCWPTVAEACAASAKLEPA